LILKKYKPEGLITERANDDQQLQAALNGIKDRTLYSRFLQPRYE
jgi:hypothetical protein